MSNIKVAAMPKSNEPASRGSEALGLVEVRVPLLPRNCPEAVIGELYCQVGQEVVRDQLLFEVGTNKVIIEVAAPCDGLITAIMLDNGDHVVADQTVLVLQAGL